MGLVNPEGETYRFGVVWFKIRVVCAEIYF